MFGITLSLASIPGPPEGCFCFSTKAVRTISTTFEKTQNVARMLFSTLRNEANLAKCRFLNNHSFQTQGEEKTDLALPFPKFFEKSDKDWEAITAQIKEEQRALQEDSLLNEADERPVMDGSLFEALLSGTEIPALITYLEEIPALSLNPALLASAKEALHFQTALSSCIGEEQVDALKEMAANLSSEVASLEKGKAKLMFLELRSSSSIGKALFEKFLTEIGDFTDGSVNDLLPFPQEEGMQWPAFPDWMVEDAHELFLDADQSGKEAAEKQWQRLKQNGFVEFIKRTVEERLKEGLETIQDNVEREGKSLFKGVPSSWFQLLKNFGCGSQKGWIKIEREEEDGTFRLTLYTNENGATTSLVYSPIDGKALNQEFFYRFLCYQAWPKWGFVEKYTLDDVKEGLLSSLSSPPTTKHVTDINRSVSLLQELLFDGIEQGRKEFFWVKVHALLERWAGVKKESNSEQLFIIQQTAKVLFHEAKELHEQGKISDEELRKVFATYCALFQRTKEKEESDPPSVLLPKIVRDKIQEFTAIIGVEEQHLNMLKAVLLEIFGVEVEEAIDTILEEIVSKSATIPLTKKTKNRWKQTVSFTEVEKLWSHRKTLRCSPLHAYRLFGEIAAVVTHPIVGTALTGLIQGFLVLTIPGYALWNLATQALVINLTVRYGPEVLETILPSQLYQPLSSSITLFQEVKSYIKERVLFHVLKTMIQWIVDSNTVEKIREEGEKFTQKALRTGFLGYTVKDVTIRRENVRFLSKRGKSAASPRKTHDSIPPLDTVTPTAKMMSQSLKRWLQESKIKCHGQMSRKEASTLSSFYLCQQIRNLPIPKKDEEGVWDEVDIEVMEDLHLLAIRLVNTGPGDYPESEKIVSLYALYAIADRLARRCPQSQLKGYLPNCGDLMVWASSLSCKVENSKTYRQLAHIADYFGFAIKKRYSLQEINEKRKHALFDYTSSYWPECVSFSGFSARFSQEAAYYRSLLKDPAIQEKLRQSGLGEDAPFFDKIALLYQNPLVEPQEKQIRASDSLTAFLEEERALSIDFLPLLAIHLGKTKQKKIDSTKPREFLPRPFHLLRSIDALARGTVSSFFSPDIDQDSQGLTFLEEQGLFSSIRTSNPYIRTTLDFLESCKAGFHRATGDLLKTKSLFVPDEMSGSLCQLKSKYSVERFNRLMLSRSFSQLKYRAGDFPEFLSSLDKRTQSEIMENDKFCSDMMVGRLSPKEQKIFEMIIFFKSDLVMRALGFFTSSPTRINDPSFQLLLSHFLFHPGALQSQIQEHPPIVKTLATFFQKTLQTAHKDLEIETETFLFETAISTARMIKKIAPCLAEKFPDYRNLLRVRMESAHGKDHQALGRVLAASYLEEDLDDPCFRKQALFDLCLFNFSPKTENVWMNVSMRCKHSHFGSYLACIRWEPLMRKTLNEDPVFRQKVMGEIFGDFSDVFEWVPFHQRKAKKSPDVSRKKNFGGKTFTRVDKGRIFCEQTRFLKHDIWLEDSEGDERALIVTKDDEVVDQTVLQKEGDNHYTFDPRLVERDGEFLHEIDLEKCRHQLSLLSWFVPLSQVKAFVNRDEPNRICRLEALGLSFRINKKNQAISDGGFSGFFIASRQNIPELKTVDRYLLLENEHGERKVLVPAPGKKTQALDFFWKKFGKEKLPPFLVKTVETHFDALNSNEETARYFVYTLEKGRLQPSDTEGCAHLLIHYFIHGKEKEAQKILYDLRSLAKRELLNPSILKDLDSLAVLLVFDGKETSLDFFLQLAALREENQLIQKGEVEKVQQSPIPGIDGDLLYCLLLQVKYRQYLKKEKNRLNPPLSETEELFILKAIGRRSQEFFTQITKGKIPDFLNLLSEHLLMLPDLTARYHVLATKHQEGLSTRERFCLHALAQVTGVSLSPSEKAHTGTITPSLIGSSFQALAHSLIKINTHPLIKGDSEISTLLKKALVEKADPQKKWDEVPVDLLELTPQDLVKNFFPYLQLILKDAPEDNAEDFNQKAEIFSESLRKLQGEYRGPTALVYQLFLGLDNLPKQMKPTVDFDALKETIYPQQVETIPIPVPVESHLIPIRAESQWKVDLEDSWCPYVRVSLQCITGKNILQYFHWYYRFLLDAPPKNFTPIQREEFEEEAERFKSSLRRLPASTSLWIASLKAVLEKEKSSLPSPEALESFFENPTTSLIPIDAVGSSPLAKKILARCAKAKAPQISSVVRLAPPKKKRVTKELFPDLIVASRKGAFLGKITTNLSGMKNQIVKRVQGTGIRGLAQFSACMIPGFTPLCLGVKGVRAMHNAYQNDQMLVKPKKKQQAVSVPFDPMRLALERQEQWMERGLKTIFDQFFTLKEIAEESTKAIEPFPIDEKEEETIRRSFEKLNRSIEDYAKRDNFGKKRIRLKQGIQPKEVMDTLKQFQQYVQDHFLEERRKIEVFNNIGKPIAFDIMLFHFIRGEDKTILQKTQLSKEDFAKMKEKLYLYLAKKSRFSLIFNAMKKKPNRPAAWGEALCRMRVYAFKEDPEKWIRAKLAFECNTGTFLWEKPMKQLERMLKSDHSALVMELIMGSGKTFFGIPTTDFMLADGEYFPINIWPAPTAKTNTFSIGQRAKKVFGQDAYSIEVTRHGEWNRHRLWAVWRALNHVREEKGQWNMTKVDVQALELRWIEHSLKAIGEDLDSSRKEELDLMAKILRLIRKKGKAVPDEAHEAFHPRKELITRSIK